MPRAEFACDRCLTDGDFPAEEASGERVLEHALVADGGRPVDVEADDSLAMFQAALLPDWAWEVDEVKEPDAEVIVDLDGEMMRTTIYRGQVKSPNMFGWWEHKRPRPHTKIERNPDGSVIHPFEE